MTPFDKAYDKIMTMPEQRGFTTKSTDAQHVPVAQIEDYKPHVTVYPDIGQCVVLPLSLINDWASGEKQPGPDDMPVIQKIIQEWRDKLEFP